MKSAFLATCLLAAVSATAMAGLPPPSNLNQQIGFDQRVGAQLPMALPFRDMNSNAETLGSITQGKPFLLAMGYYRCPNLCSVVLHGMAKSVSEISLHVGSDYQVIFISIDPHETSANAMDAARMLLRMNPTAHVGQWHFLTGPQASIHGVADAIGFRYFYDPRLKQYAHAAGVVALTGEGKVSQYFFGVDYPAGLVHVALIGATRGGLGHAIDQLVMLCCGYDPSTGRYTFLIGNVMRIVGLSFVVLALLGGWLYSRRSMRR